MEASESIDAFRQELGINEEGWMLTELYEDSFRRNRELRRKLTDSAEDNLKNEVWKCWPFKDDDDDSDWNGG